MNFDIRLYNYTFYLSLLPAFGFTGWKFLLVSVDVKPEKEARKIVGGIFLHGMG